jgi:hypothetical protein
MTKRDENPTPEKPQLPKSSFADLDKLRLSVSSTVLGGTAEILSKALRASLRSKNSFGSIRTK